MVSNRTEYSLDQICDFINGFAFKSTDYVPKSKDTLEVFRMGYIERDGGFKEDSTPVFVPKEYGKDLSRFFLQKGDITMAMTDMKDRVAILGNTARVNQSDRFVLNQRVGCIRVREHNIVDARFLYYYSNQRDHVEELRSYANRGVQVNLSTSAIKASTFDLPPLPEQKAIAHILGTLDDKIELNRRMNATLEGMAQALFKSWFVDFDPVIDNALAAGNPIPDELAPRAEVRKEALANGTTQQGSLDHPTLSDAKSLFPAAFQFNEELAWIPEGWEVKQLDEHIKLIGGGTPKTSVEEYWNGDIPWFSVVDAPNDSDVFVINTEKKITEEGLNNSSTKLLRPGTTIISARGTVGRCALVGVEMTMNQSCYGIQGADGASDSYTYYSIRHYVADLQQRGHGSVFNTITRDTFRSIKVPFGSAELTEAFEDQVADLLSRIKGNLQEQSTLTKLRDTLLPKLISGELRIPEAEQLTKEALT